MIHRLDILHGGGAGRTRVLAYRTDAKADSLRADFDLLVIDQRGNKWPSIAAEGTMADFPRGLGIEGLFATVLTKMSTSENPARDECGNVIPLPSKSGDEWFNEAEGHLQLAMECWRQARKSGHKSKEFHDILWAVGITGDIIDGKVAGNDKPRRRVHHTKPDLFTPPEGQSP